MTAGKSYDVVVIGAGSVGLPVALNAARDGLSTLVIDGRASAGQGEAKTAIGGVRATHSDPAKIRVCLRSIKTFSQWKEREGDELGWQKGGYLFPVYSEKDETTLKGLLEIQKSHGLNINWIGPEEVEKLVPGKWKIVVPEKYHIGHEAHFKQVTEKYLRYLKDGKLPKWEVPNMIAKYYTTTEALKAAGQ